MSDQRRALVLGGGGITGIAWEIGVPDARYGEAPLAVVAPRDTEAPPTPEELSAWCRERLARYKHPREYAFVPALPRNPSGKVLKTSLRTEHRAGSLVSDPAV